MRLSCLAPLLLLVACKDGDALLPWAFPDGFEWGVATSAFQVEGEVENDYTRWIDEGNAPQYGKACDFWNRWESDAELAADLGLDRFRLSIEWARVEPEPGVWDEGALGRYRTIIEGLRDQGMSVVVTLHHYTNPTWFADQGGWESASAADEFAAYAGHVASRLGDLVDDWNPQNEPMVYISGLTLAASFPGGTLNDSDRFDTVLRRYLEAHAQAAAAIRGADRSDVNSDGTNARIWVVAAISPTEPADPASAEDVEAARKYDEAYNQAWIRALTEGVVTLDPEGGVSETRPDLADTVDILGINYYSRAFIVPFQDTPLGGIPCSPPLTCGDRNDLEGDNGNEVYPPGIYEAVVDLSRYGLPMYITENGVADADDSVRPTYLVTHLMQLSRALAEGYDVGGYLHWSLLDNYEWTWGYDMRFGLYDVDFATWIRRPREDSIAVYKDIIFQNRLTDEVISAWNDEGINP